LAIGSGGQLRHKESKVAPRGPTLRCLVIYLVDLRDPVGTGKSAVETGNGVNVSLAVGYGSQLTSWDT
jgi:hypothetical protein